MHPSVLDFVRRVLARTGPRSSVVDLGGRDVNGSARALFGAARYLAVDQLPGAGVDVIADAATFALARPVDTVVCTSVLEHTPHAAALCASAGRLLAPGGVFIVTTVTDPFPPHSAIDGSLTLAPGEFYRNPTRSELLAWLEPFADVWLEHHHASGDLFACAWASAER
jgi:SAM-dependent methyltransferase